MGRRTWWSCNPSPHAHGYEATPGYANGCSRNATNETSSRYANASSYDGSTRNGTKTSRTSWYATPRSHATKYDVQTTSLTFLIFCKYNLYKSLTNFTFYYFLIISK